MDLYAEIFVLCLVLWTLSVQVALSETVRAFCFETETGYRARFRLRKDQPDDSDINGLEAYDASVNPLSETPIAASGSGCSSFTSVPGNNNVFALSFEFATGSSTCGTDGDTVLIRANGTMRFWEFSCSDPNVIPHEIFENDINTGGEVDYHRHMPNPFDVKFQAFEANGDSTPVTTAHLGQDIKLRLIYNTGQIESGPDNWGMTFHTGFIPHDTVTDLILQIVTTGLGTKVHITGQLTDYELDMWVSVKRDSAAEVTIPAAYMETDATLLDWTIQSRGIKVESMHDRIGVKSITKIGSFILSPDDILGSEYNGLSLVEGLNSKYVITAVEDNTSVDIMYNDYSPRSDLNVNDVDADTGTSTDDIILNEYDTLNIECTPGKCFHLKFLSDKPIAVIFGSYFSSQLLPVINYDDYFILITTSSGLYISQHEDPTITGDVYYNDYFGPNLTFSNFPFVQSYNTEHLIGIPVGYYLYQDASGPNDPYLFPMPSIDQWGAFNYFYAKEGATYSLIFVGRIDEVTNITFKTGSVTTSLVGSSLGEQPGFSPVTLNELYARDERYERYDVSVSISDNGPEIEQALVEFKGATPVDTFLMIIEETTESYSTVYQPFGVRYPSSNPCVSTSLIRPGDLINNDCDEYTDEELANGIDDDGDGDIDEDLALDLVSPATGIYASELILCTDAQCTTERLIYKFGCYDYYDVYGDGSHLDIGAFQHNTNLADEFDNYYVIDTPPFDAFRYVNDDTIYFMVTYGMCFGNLTKCENLIIHAGKLAVTCGEQGISTGTESRRPNMSCLETTKKRSIQEVNGVKLSLQVIRDNTNNTFFGKSQF